MAVQSQRLLQFHRKHLTEVKQLAQDPKPSWWLYPCMPGQGEPNEKHAVAFWVLYNRYFVKKEIRDPSPSWTKFCWDGVVFPSKKHSVQNCVGLPTVKVTEWGCSCLH